MLEKKRPPSGAVVLEKGRETHDRRRPSWLIFWHQTGSSMLASLFALRPFFRLLLYCLPVPLVGDLERLVLVVGIGVWMWTNKTTRRVRLRLGRRKLANWVVEQVRLMDWDRL